MFIVTMQAQKEVPPLYTLQEKFLLQSAVASPRISPKDTNTEVVIM